MPNAVLRLHGATPLPGYAYGLRAPGLLARVEFAVGADWAGLIRRSRLLLQSHLPADSQGHTVAPRRAVAMAALEYLATLVRSLQEAAGMPRLGEARVRLLPASSARIANRSVQQGFMAMPALVPQAGAAALHWAIQWFNALALHQASGLLAGGQEGSLKSLFDRMGQRAPRGTNNRCFLQAAHDLGIPCVPLTGGVFQYGWGRNSRWMDSSFTENTSSISSKLARSKMATSAILRQAGLPVPEHVPVKSADEAVAAAGRLGFPVVVKPASLDGGAGVSAGLISEEEIRRAYARARRLSADILVERHAAGRDYRVYVFRGKAVWAMERIPAGVTGDGASTVRALVEDLNRDPRRTDASWSPMTPVRIDAEAQELLAAASLGPEAVPDVGRFVRLKRAANVSTGGTPVGVFAEMHPDNALLCERATQVLRLDLSGVDVLMSDIRRSWRETGAAICEVNAQPQLSGATAPQMYAQILRGIVPGQGRIPVVLMLTSSPERESAVMLSLPGSERRGIGVTVGSGLWTRGSYVRQGRESVFRDTRGLLADKSLDAILIITDGEEFLRTGLPVDRIDLMAIADWYPSGGRSIVREVLSLAAQHCAAETVAIGPPVPEYAAVLGSRVRMLAGFESLRQEVQRVLLGK